MHNQPNDIALQLAESEDRFNTIFHANTTGKCITDITGKMIDVNEAFIQISGYSRDELIGQKSTDIGFVDEKTREVLIAKLQVSGYVRDAEIKAKHKDNTLRIVLYSSSFITMNGTRCILTIVQDITKRKTAEESLISTNLELEKKIESLKESEEKFQNVFKANPAGITIATVDGVWIDANASFSKMTGFAHDEVVGQTSIALGFIDSIERDRLLGKYREKGELKNEEALFKAKSGEYKVGLFSSLPIFVDGVRYTITLIYDITERKKAEEDIKRMNMELERKVLERTAHLEDANKIINGNLDTLSIQKRQLEDFCNIVSHNLRSPLSNITILTDFIKEASDEFERDALIEKMKTVSINLNDIFNELVESLQIQNDSEIVTEKLNITDYYQRTIEILEGEVKQTGAKVETDFTATPFITCAPKYFSSIMQNLVSNALKYKSPKRTPVIKIKTIYDNDSIILSVSDNGLGIDLKRHSSNMYKIRKVFHNHPDAKGFGLFLTKTQVVSMGGKIWAESTPDVGTTFYVKFINQKK